MRHARKDYERFQDPEGLIPDDEPVFLIRGQDLAAPGALRAWIELARAHGATDDILAVVDRHANAMESWQRNRTAKTPDL